MTIMPSAASSRSVANSSSRWSAEMPGGGLVEDEHARTEPEQPRDLDLLALADRQRARRRLEVEAEAEAVAQLLHLVSHLCRASAERARAAEQEVVEHRHGQEDQGILVQHADAGRRSRRPVTQLDSALPSSTISPESAT